MTGVLDTLAAYGVLPVVVIDRALDADYLAEALVGGGLPLAEVTLRTPASLDAIRTLALRADTLVGAGTVLTPTQVDQAVDAGAAFVASPGFSRPVVERCVELGVPVVPGTVTPTEVMAALDLGVSCVNVFPAHAAGGPPAVAVLGEVFPDLRIIASGGIGPDDAASYLALPQVVAVGGSWMVRRTLVLAREVTTIARLCREAVELVAGVRSASS
ncbi:bifunctional 4-hydroxy-2-oxoglutarate aldolase/2-dehydro-3-deoxy-phosphogluconate aldolase [Cellulomonas sp. URHD0024]|uniref:bifunctional 4-hydroxy-2-oxoglutarate aldolase/2-dehydro-3-deoxy-phosphogluconate aldolase n=1 Tax=Cellulomonas sp. URHD0024 TaxID=1302620 RepID=UPI0004235CCF|nr:bifunctional 4-hydroxy-2-oxoglutarate aldolase/2-dehydro-3-deoxy-phosphogluconate aldolase [Cellulomonas sp. URHD0024]